MFIYKCHIWRYGDPLAFRNENHMTRLYRSDLRSLFLNKSVNQLAFCVLPLLHVFEAGPFLACDDIYLTLFLIFFRETVGLLYAVKGNLWYLYYFVFRDWSIASVLKINIFFLRSEGPYLNASLMHLVLNSLKSIMPCRFVPKQMSYNRHICIRKLCIVGYS